MFKVMMALGLGLIDVCRYIDDSIYSILVGEV